MKINTINTRTPSTASSSGEEEDSPRSFSRENAPLRNLQIQSTRLRSGCPVKSDASKRKSEDSSDSSEDERFRYKKSPRLEPQDHDSPTSTGLSPALHALRMGKALGDGFHLNFPPPIVLKDDNIRKTIVKEIEAALRSDSCKVKCQDGFHFIPHELMAKEIEIGLYKKYKTVDTEYDRKLRYIRHRILGDSSMRELICRSEISITDIVDLSLEALQERFGHRKDLHAAKDKVINTQRFIPGSSKNSKPIVM